MVCGISARPISLSIIMGRQQTSEDQSLATATARNYRAGAHRTEDTAAANKINYQPKTMKDQDIALRLYEK